MSISNLVRLCGPPESYIFHVIVISILYMHTSTAAILVRVCVFDSLDNTLLDTLTLFERGCNNILFKFAQISK